MGQLKSFTLDELAVIDRVFQQLDQLLSTGVQLHTPKADWDLYQRWLRNTHKFVSELEGRLPFILSHHEVSKAVLKSVIAEGGKRV